jgi:hypothetical protein
METMYPWEQQPHEGIHAFDAFAVYRDLGPDRSIDRAWRSIHGADETGAKRSGKKKTLLERRWRLWFSEFNWLTRANAYDRYLLKMFNKAREQRMIELTGQPKASAALSRSGIELSE